MEAPNGSFYWYDLETSGTSPLADRIMQSAGLRTDLDLVPIDEPFSTYIKLPPDIVPTPESCLITGITPQRTLAAGRGEWEALTQINDIFSVGQTCIAGFNNLRFDDEFIRHAFYRNLLDPYAREWRDGNSRWDIIDLVRATGALRPEGIEWPVLEDKPSFRLEAMSQANDLAHTSAHDALSDVYATIAVACLIRTKQPKIFAHFLKLRSKHEVRRLLVPFGRRLCVHASRMFANARHCTAPVISIAQHPSIDNSIIVVDLGRDVSSLIEGSIEEIREALFGEDVEERPPLKQVRINKCPFVAPINVVRPADAKRLGIDLDLVNERKAALLSTPDLDKKIASVFRSPEGGRPETRDAEERLYDGFASDADRARCDELQRALRSNAPWPDLEFRDPRMATLNERLKARLRPSSLAPDALTAWNQFVAARLHTEHSRRLTVNQYRSEVAEHLADSPNARDESILRALDEYGVELERRAAR